MKTEFLELAVPIRARCERFALHQLPLPPCEPLLPCAEALEPKPPRDTWAVPIERLPGRASLVDPALCVLLVLP